MSGQGRRLECKYAHAKIIYPIGCLHAYKNLGAKSMDCICDTPIILGGGLFFGQNNYEECVAGWLSPMCSIHMCLVHQRNVAMHGKYLMVIWNKIIGGWIISSHDHTILFWGCRQWHDDHLLVFEECRRDLCWENNSRINSCTTIFIGGFGNFA